MTAGSQALAKRVAGSVIDSIALTFRVFRDMLLYSGAALGMLAFFMSGELAQATYDQRMYVATRVILGVGFVIVTWHIFLSPKAQWLRAYLGLERKG